MTKIGAGRKSEDPNVLLQFTFTVGTSNLLHWCQEVRTRVTFGQTLAACCETPHADLVSGELPLKWSTQQLEGKHWRNMKKKQASRSKLASTSYELQYRVGSSIHNVLLNIKV